MCIAIWKITVELKESDSKRERDFPHGAYKVCRSREIRQLDADLQDKCGRRPVFKEKETFRKIVIGEPRSRGPEQTSNRSNHVRKHHGSRGLIQPGVTFIMESGTGKCCYSNHGTFFFLLPLLHNEF